MFAVETIKSWFSSRRKTNQDEAFHAVYDNFSNSDLQRVAKKGLRDSKGLTLLHHSVLDHDLQKVAALCQAGIDMYATVDNKTPLHLALMMGSVEVTRALLEGGCCPRHPAVSKLSFHPWHLVMTIEDGAVVKELTALLVQHGADVNREITVSGLESALHVHELAGMAVCRDFAPAIHLAICRNDLELVNMVLTAGAELDRTCNSCSALTRALTLNIDHRLDIVKLLIAAGADLNDAEELIHTPSECSWDFTPLQISVLCSGVSAVREGPIGALRRRVSDATRVTADRVTTGVTTDKVTSGETTDKVAVVRTLLAAGADPNLSAAECKYHDPAPRPLPALPVPIHEHHPCLYPVCLAVHSGWVPGLTELIKANCDLAWERYDHLHASRLEHTSPLEAALTGPDNVVSCDHLEENSASILEVLSLLYEAGCDFFAMSDVCITGIHRYISSHRKHALSQWFHSILTTPLPLRLTARLVIRRHLGPNPINRYSEMTKFLPKKVVDYVLFIDSTE